jgi:hypothetical protein
LSAASFYVYYKVDLARLDALRRAVHAVFATLERECGVRGRWLRRRDDPATYMEIYEDVRDAAAFERVLVRASEDCRVSECLAPGAARRTEIFMAAD